MLDFVFSSSRQSLPETCRLGHYDLVVQKNPRRKSIAIRMQSQQYVLQVPAKTSKSQLKQVLTQHQDWFLKRLKILDEQSQQQFLCLPEQQFHFKGQLYQNVWLDNHQHNNANTLSLDELNQQMLFPRYSEQQEEQQKACRLNLQNWFMQQAHAYLTPKLEFYAQQMGVEFKSMTIKGYKSRWGSCYSDGRIQFNWRLMQAPEWVIDYVVVHELAHLVHANHSKDFWQLVQQFYPQTALAKQHLKQYGGLWIEFLQK